MAAWTATAAVFASAGRAARWWVAQSIESLIGRGCPMTDSVRSLCHQSWLKQ